MADKVLGNMVFDRQGPMWHGKGHVDPKVTSAVKAVKKYGMDFIIHLVDTYANVKGKQMVLTPKASIMREPIKEDPEWRFFGHASHDYRIMQNTEVADVVDLLTDVWSLETVGVLEEGKTIFFTLNAGAQNVAKDEIKQYFLVTDTRDGGTSLKIAFTPVRTVCWNTLTTGLKQSLVTIPLTHYGDLSAMLTMRVNALKKLQTAQETTMGIFAKLAKKKMTAEDFDTILEAVFPLPEKSRVAMLADEFKPENYPDIGEALIEKSMRAQTVWNYTTNYWLGKRENVRNLLVKFNDEFKASANTLWAGYNVVAEFADWRAGSEDVAISALWGARAQEKKRAFAQAQVLLKK
jgi:hypothetical protein